MTTDDDDIDDASLRSMRAVWLSMRDEEPPAAGMSGLLAAAREKAEQMKQPTLWQRVTALLRRPPALAFATVMILIGGAVLVTRTTQDKVESEVAGAPATPPGDTFGAREQRVQPAPEPAAAEPTAGSAQIATEIAPPPNEPAPATEPADGDKPRRVRTNRPKPRVKDAVAKQVDDDKYVKEEVDLGEGKPPERGLEGQGSTGRTTLDSPVHISPDTTKKPASKPEPRKPTVTTTPDLQTKGGEAPASEQEDTVIVSDKATGKPTTPPVEQLARQAESAAARRDCAAVRVIVARIKKQDASYYKTRVATNAAIAKCL